MGSALYQLIGQACIVFANGSGDRGSIAGRVIPKTWKMVFDTTLRNTQVDNFIYPLAVKFKFSLKIKSDCFAVLERTCFLRMKDKPKFPVFSHILLLFKIFLYYFE